MKTIQDFLIEKGIKSNLDIINVPQVKEWLLEYSEYLLQLAAKKANIILKDYYSEDFTIGDEETVRYNSSGVSSVYADECTRYNVSVNQDSILNIINELK